jgi:hypothetical protein
VKINWENNLSEFIFTFYPHEVYFLSPLHGGLVEEAELFCGNPVDGR